MHVQFLIFLKIRVQSSLTANHPAVKKLSVNYTVRKSLAKKRWAPCLPDFILRNMLKEKFTRKKSKKSFAFCKWRNSSFWDLHLATSVRLVIKRTPKTKRFNVDYEWTETFVQSLSFKRVTPMNCIVITDSRPFQHS